MNWEKLIYQIESRFEIKKRKKESFLAAETLKGKKIFGEKETIEFKTPQGDFCLENIRKPKILEKKVLSSKRIGAGVAVDYIYSEEEKTSHVKIYKSEGGEWKEIDLNAIT